MKLHPDAFLKLLEALSPVSADAGQQYEHLRQRLIRFFGWERSAVPEELADEVLDRVARKLHAGEPVRDPVAFSLGVARLVAQEDRTRNHRRQALLEEAAREHEQWQPPVETPAHPCFESCFQELAPESRALLLAYYSADGRLRIERRKGLAMRLGIDRNALRNRALRLRERLEICIERCHKREQRSSVMHPGSRPTPDREPNDMTGLPSTTSELTEYLAGTLPGDRRESIQARLEKEPEFFDELQELEYDLCDSYVRHHLGGPFHQRFAALERDSPYWRERMNVARALRARERLFNRPPSRTQRVWQVLAVAASLVAVFAVYRWQEVRRHMERLAPLVLQVTPAPAPASAPAPVVYTATLIAGVLRDAAPQALTLPAAAQWVDLQLEATGVAAGAAFSAELRQQPGDLVWQQSQLVAAAPGRLRLMLPTGVLRPGSSYLLTVRAGAETYDYALRVNPAAPSR